MSAPSRSARSAIIALLVLAACAASSIALRPRSHDEPLAAALDHLAASVYAHADRPGAAVIVVKDGVPVLRKGYGLANLELGVPIAPDMVFEIGSVTKQFTAAAILILAQEHKLALDVNFRKYTDKYVTVPMHEENVSIEALLTHTSGIPNYTDMSAWQEKSRSDVTLQALIDVFWGEKFDFSPGASWRYSNSGYVLLGAVVEAVSGMRYADFLQQRIFQPLHMTQTACGDQSRVVPRRASGYDLVNGHYVNASYLSMTQSFAAGAILSTVDDLAAWNAALDGHSLLSDESKAKMWTAFKLADGRDTGYGYGWRVGNRDGRSVQEHGGLITGYVSHVVRLPEDHVYVAVLTNDYSRGTDPGRLAEELAVTAAGHPRVDPPAASRLSLSGDLAGAYQGPFDQRYTIVFSDGQYGVQRNQETVPLVPMAADAFFIKGEFSRFTFERDAARKPARLRVQGFANEAIATRSAAVVPLTRAALALPDATLDRYVGVYQMPSSGTMTVRRAAGRMFARIGAQPEFEIFAEAENRFFLKSEQVDAQLTFQADSSGRVTGLIFHQNGKDYPCVKR